MAGGGGAGGAFPVGRFLPTALRTGKPSSSLGFLLSPFLLVKSSIRPKWELFHCELCTGFWVGMFNWFMIDLPFNFFVAGCISAGVSYLLSKIVDDEGIAIKNK